MPINSLQQKAFSNSEEFRNQVDAEVKKQGLDAAESLTAEDPNKELMSRVIKQPETFFFPQTIIADYDWTVKFDPWAENPASAAGAIQTFVTKWFPLLTNIWPVEPEVLVAPTSAPPQGKAQEEEGPPP